MKEYALRYVQQWGWPVFPVAPGVKMPLTAHGFHDASTDPEQIEAWWTQWPDANIGIPTGAVSGLIAIDADVKNGQPGKESFYKLKLPHTRTSRTPTGGWHALYKHPGIEIRNRTGLLPGIDVRGDGGYIVVPPSKVNGAHYSWLNELEPVAVPEALLKRLTSKPTRLQVANGAKIGEGRRNDYLARQGGALRGQGVQQDALIVALLAENQSRCEPPLPDREVRKIAASISRYEAPLLGDAEWPDPTPLPDELPAVEPFDPGLMPDSCRAWVEDVAERMQCPPDFPAVAVMVVLSSLIGRSRRIRPKAEDDWTVTPNLWGAVVGRPGIMKSPALNEVLKFVKSVEAEVGSEFKEAVADHELTLIEYRARRKLAEDSFRSALKKNPDARFEMDLAEPDDPIRRRFVVNDSTVEKLGELLNENPNGLLLFRDELVGFLRNMDRRGREGDRAFYLEAWNGDSSFTYDRIGRGTVEIEAACVSILGGIQPGPLMGYLRTLAVNSTGDDGLLQRFQLLVWPDVAREWRDVDRPVNVSAFGSIRALIEKLATDKTDNRASVSSVSCQHRHIESKNYALKGFNNDAQNLFRHWRERLEHRIRGEEDHPVIESHLSKYRSLVPSLALIISVADDGGGLVSDIAVERAIRWATYLETHARRIYHPVIHADVDAALLLAKKLVKGKVSCPFALRDVYRNGWAGLSDPTTVEGAVHVLEDFDWLRATRVATSGRSRLFYEINPKVLNMPRLSTDKTDRSDSNVPF